MQSCTTRIFDSQTRSRESNPASPSLNRQNPGTIRERSGNSLHSKRATVARRCKRKHFKHFQTFSNLDVSTCSKSSQLVVSTGAVRCRLLNSKRNWRMTPRKSCRTCRRSWMERTRNCKQCPGYHWSCSDVSNLSKVFRTSNFSDIFRLGLQVNAFCHSLYDFLSVSTMIWCINRADLVHDF